MENKSSSLRYIAIIPARYASTRFPGKPLALLGGIPIIQRVYERVQACINDVCVATDDERIMKCVEEFGGNVVMTGTHHKSGTDRCYEALCLQKKDYDVVINVQGDEPFIAASQLAAVQTCFDDETTKIATLVKPFTESDGWESLQNPNTPKVVISNDSTAMYFSRSVIPYFRGMGPENWLHHHTFYKHIGLYAYRSEVLGQITRMPLGVLEQVESLEQLRWLQAGLKIKVALTHEETIGIDTPEDLARAEEFLRNQQ